MRVEKWTLGLAAVGLVSLPAVVQAEEKPSPLMTALTGTTISGYVDTSAHWDPGTGNANAPAFIYNRGKQDGFNLNKVKLRVERPLDESSWAAGYKVDLLFGPDASEFGSSSWFGESGTDFAIQQAYVLLRAPVGNGLDFKMGVFDSIIGYESHDSVNDPNYTRSWATTIEPHTHTGLLLTYQFADWITVAGGIANTFGPSINERAFHPYYYEYGKAESYKTYMGSIALTAPSSMGFLEGSTLYAGIVNGFDTSWSKRNPDDDWTYGVVRTHYYAGLTLATPVKGLKLGASYDYSGVNEQELENETIEASWINAINGYVSFQATEKLSLHVRGEYLWMDKDLAPSSDDYYWYRGGFASKIFALTGTVQYDLWKNVLSRIEARWDHAADGSEAFGGEERGYPTDKNAVMIAANIIYKF